MKRVIAMIAGLSFMLCGCNSLVKPLEEETNYSQVETEDYKLYRGDFYDRNNVFIAGIKYGKDGSAKRVFATDIPYAFSNVLGNLAGKKHGLDYEYDELLRVKNNNQIDINGGISIISTFDAEIQNKIYEMISLEYKDYIGSVILMKQNGEIITDISFPSFDHTEFLEKAEKIEQEISFNNKSLEIQTMHMRNLPNINDLIKEPESGLNDIHFYDKNFLDCDFGRIPINKIIDLETNNKGFMQVSPIYAASLLRRTLINDGVMPKPFTILEFTDPDDYTIKIKDYEVINKLKKAKANRLSDISDERINRWEKIFKERAKSNQITLDPSQFNEGYFNGTIGCFRAQLGNSHYKFVGKVEAEKVNSFWCLGMLLNKEQPDNSLIIVCQNSQGIIDQEELRRFFQQVINIIVNSNP